MTFIMNSEQLVETTKKLIAIPSTADNPAALKEAIDVLAKIASKPGVTVEWFEHNGKHSFLAYRGTTRPAKFDLLLSAHVDVVPGEPELFSPRIENGRLYGRGALDMKGTGVVMASVFAEMVNEVPYALGLQVVTDEEIGGYDCARYQIEQGLRSNFVVMGEYSNERNTIYNAARGICWAEISFKGLSAHGGHLWHGSNAVVKAGNFAAAILSHYPTPDEETWTTTASIANLYTPNDTYNRVPDTAILKIDFRFTQEDPVFENRGSLEAFIASLDPDARLLHVATFEPATHVDEQNPYVQGLSEAIRQNTHEEPRFDGRPGGSDGRHFALVNNDIIEFGLYGKGSHGDEEYVELSSFDEYREILRTYLRNPILEPVAAKAETPDEPLSTQLLSKLVAIPSLSDDAEASSKALGFVGQFLETRGMHTEYFENKGFRSLYASTRADNKQPTVLLSAHIDVVPGKPEQFVLRTENGRLYGRGVMDMKFAIASYMCLVDKLAADLQSYDFGILLTSDEELGGRNGTNIAVNEHGLRPKVAVIPDGGENWQLETFAKGVQWVKLEANGKASHASRPWEGESAISALLGALHEIEQLAPQKGVRNNTSISVGTIEGGTAGNQIPAHASAMLDIRYGSMEDFESIYPKIHKICAAHKITDELLVSDAPCISDMDNPYIKTFRETIQSVTGKEPGEAFSHGATDGRYFSAHGIPTIIVSPESNGRHTEDEWLSKKGYEQFIQVLLEYVSKTAYSSKPHQPARTARQQYVWYATYGTGLSKENFLCYVKGGQPKGAAIAYPGCSDKTLPLKDTFMSLPYELYFAGESLVWGGGFVSIKPERDLRANTISRAYLITLEQFKEIVSQHNLRADTKHLPLEEAKLIGHATIDEGSGDYDGLVYCGEREGWPIYTLTASKLRQPFVAPSPVYTQLLCQGLSEDNRLGVQSALDYFLPKPGIAGYYGQSELEALLQNYSSLGHQADALRSNYASQKTK